MSALTIGGGGITIDFIIIILSLINRIYIIMVVANSELQNKKQTNKHIPTWVP